MEIMRWVVKVKEERRLIYYLSFYILGFSTAAVSFFGVCHVVDFVPNHPFALEWTSDYLWYIPNPVMTFVTFCLWMYYAPAVCQHWDMLKTAFPGAGYETLYGHCQGWLRQFSLTLPGRCRAFKSFYLIAWILFTPCFLIFIVCALEGNHPWIVTTGAFLLTGVIFILNFSSCYICIIFVYFLIRVYNLETEEKLDYVKQFPSATSGFQILNHFASIVYLYFLLDSLFSTVSYYAFWKIVSNEDLVSIAADRCQAIRLAFLGSAVFLLVFGLVTWCFIVLVSRAYLRRLHNAWKLRSFQAYGADYCRQPGDNSVREQAAIAMENLTRDKISMDRWEILISLTALAANLGTAWSIFNSQLK